jgi:hypothetical protein
MRVNAIDVACLIITLVIIARVIMGAALTRGSLRSPRMLAPQGNAFLVTCDLCRSAKAAVDAPDIDAARVQLAALGWQERAQRGKGRAKWHWVCPACVPPRSRGLGPST